MWEEEGNAQQAKETPNKKEIHIEIVNENQLDFFKWSNTLAATIKNK